MNKRLEDVGDTSLGAPESLAGGGVVRVWQESDVSLLVRGLQSHDDPRGGDAVDVSLGRRARAPCGWGSVWCWRVLGREERLEKECSIFWEHSFDIEISCSAIGINF